MNWSLASHPRLKLLGVGVAVLLLVLIVIASFMDEPLRAYAERRANQALDGYHVTIGSLDFHPLRLSLDLENVVLAQEKRLDQPLVKIARWTASIQRREILTGNVVSDHRIEKPVVHFTRTQAAEEMRDERDVKKRAWQKAVLNCIRWQSTPCRLSTGM